MEKTRLENWLPYLLGAWVVFLCAIEVGFIGLSLADIPQTVPIAWGVTCFALVGGLGVSWTGFRRASLQTSPHPGVFPPWPALVIILLALFLLVVTGGIALRIFDYSWDSNTYHLPTVHFWLLQKKIVWIHSGLARDHLLNGYPKSLEVLAYWLASLGDPSLYKLANVLMWPLAFLGIACLSLQLGAGLTLSLLAGLLYLLVPTQWGQGITLYVDAAFASCVIAFWAFLLPLFNKTAAPPKSLFVFGGLSLGLMLGIKASAPAIAAPILILAFVYLFREKRLKSYVPLFLLLSALAILVGGFWYIRNYIVEGSPLYPVGVTFFGYSLFPGYSAAQAMSEQSLTPRLFTAMPDMLRLLTSWSARVPPWVDYYDCRLGGIGASWLFVEIPAILVLLLWGWFSPNEKWKTLWRVLAATVLIAFLLHPMHWWARYTLWLHALGLPTVMVLAMNLKRFWLKAGLLILLCGLFVFADRPSPLAKLMINRAYCLEQPSACLSPSCLLRLRLPSEMTRVATSKEPIAFGTSSPFDLSGFGLFVPQLGERQIFGFDPRNHDPDLPARLDRSGVRWVISADLWSFVSVRGKTVKYVSPWFIIERDLPPRT